MQILLAHNYYGSTAPSGENMVFELERDMLLRHGHEVSLFTRHSDSIRAMGAVGLLVGGLSVPWNIRAAIGARQAAESAGAEILHVHNTFPLISPGIFWTVGRRVARVLTLHNYRIYCPGGLPFRKVSVCVECIDRRSIVPSLRYGCYRSSRLATLPLACSTALHRGIGTWSTKVDAFIVLSTFQRDLMVKGGLPAEKIHIKPNFFPSNPVPVPIAKRGNYVLYAGRLSHEKGVDLLVRAWLAWGERAPELHILGDGPLKQGLMEMARDAPTGKISFLGQVPPGVVEGQMANARMVVVPSVCFEGFPMVIREAFAFGTPVAVSALGPLPSVVEDGRCGLLFAPGNASDLLAKVAAAFDSPVVLESLSARARESFEESYTEEANYQRLLEIYRAALDISSGRST
jgi:glycosyltransferase involved in cell wall biosynthesis